MDPRQAGHGQTTAKVSGAGALALLATRAAGGTAGPSSRPVQDWDRFEVRGFLGQGGMGRVFEGWDVHLQRRVALKFLHTQLAGESERLLREGRAQALIDHPHVVKIFEAGEVGGVSYLAMQLVPGKSLQELGPGLPLAERLRVLVQACEAVHAAHRLGLLHRDLKPANLLVDVQEDGRCHAFVSDFGMARALTSEETAAGGLEGTPAFMSPEQIRQQGVDARSDVYGLGACLYVTLTGHPPFVAPNYLDLMAQVLEQPPLAPGSWCPDLPGDAVAIALRCLAKDPAQRYPSAKALAEDLERYLAGKPVHARPVTLVTRVRKGVGRNPVAVALALLAVALFSVGMTIQTLRLARERTRANREADMARSSLAFLEGVFQQVRPSGKQGPTITVKELLDHGRSQIDGLGDQPLLQARIQEMLGNLYVSFGLFDVALPLEEHALRTLEQARGPEHPEVAQGLNDLGMVLYAQGRYPEAEGLHRRALAIREKALGPGHPDVATSLNNLALTASARGAQGEAERLHRRALAIRQQALGPDHPDVAASLNCLAIVAYDQERYDEAARLHKEALAIREKALGPDHPKVAQSLNNLANVATAQGRYPEAERMHKRVLAIWEKILGPDHPDVATSLENLAIAYHEQGAEQEAEALDRRALAIKEKALGPDHPEVATILNNLANVYTVQGRYPEAEAMARRALAIWARTLGPDHLNVAMGLYNLADICLAMGRTGAAEPLRRRSMAIFDKTFGPRWPPAALVKFASLDARMGHRDEALGELERAVAGGGSGFATDTGLVSLQGDPRFRKLVDLASRKNLPGG